MSLGQAGSLAADSTSHQSGAGPSVGSAKVGFKKDLRNGSMLGGEERPLGNPSEEFR